MEQGALAVWLEWLCVDSASAVHNINDRQSHVNHRAVKRMRFCMGRLVQLITVLARKAMVSNLFTM
jgi:hypothetical protein